MMSYLPPWHQTLSKNAGYRCASKTWTDYRHHNRPHSSVILLGTDQVTLPSSWLFHTVLIAAREGVTTVLSAPQIETHTTLLETPREHRPASVTLHIGPARWLLQSPQLLV